MKRSLPLLLVAIVLLSSCGGKEGTLVRFSCDAEGPYAARLYGEDGLDIGTVQLERGDNRLSLPLPCYLQYTPPAGYDCPAVYTDGSSVSLKVTPAAYSEEEGAYLYTYTVFLAHARAGKEYRLQICRTEDGVPVSCRTAYFEGREASLPLTEGSYLTEVFEESTLVLSEPFTFLYDAPHFSIAEVTNEA